MKTSVFLGCFTLAFLAIAGCEKPDKDLETNLSEAELQRPIADSTRLRVIEDWQQFRKETGESLLLAQEKLDKLQTQCTDEENTQQIRLRRVYGSCDYKLEKLKTKLLRAGIKFRNNIGHYTVEDVLKNESWRTGFSAKLAKLHADLDQALAQP